MNQPDNTKGLDEIFNKSPIDKEVPDDIWGTIHSTWTGLWTDGYGEWDEKQPSDIYPLSDLLSTEAQERLKQAILHWIDREVIKEDDEMQDGEDTNQLIAAKNQRLRKRNKLRAEQRTILTQHGYKGGK